jgi:hypothetical protein
MKQILLGIALLLFATIAVADVLPFELNIKGGDIDVHKSLELSDVGEGKTQVNFDFEGKSGNKYNFDLKYKSLPENRSYPANLDITLKDSDGNKLGYLFFANNGVQFLKKMGLFGLIVDIDGEPVDISFTFDKDAKGDFSVDDLGDERFIQDTLVPKHSFQMIRPVVLPEIEPGVRSATYSLDDHPYSINYTLKNIDNGLVQFQHNLYQKIKGESHLLERIYFNASSLEVLREAMYAGKYFHQEDGTFKLVFYPAMGQTEPPK